MSTPARAAVAALLDNAAAAARARRVVNEVAYLESIFERVVKELDDALNPSLAAFGWSSKTRGIYVHQRPVVRFPVAGKLGGCEIGDLLIVLHTVGGSRPGGHALLLQSKVKPFPFALSGKERRQWALYHQWPEFWWRDRFAYAYLGGDGRRHVRPARPHLGAQYLAIDGTRFEVALSQPGYRAGADPVRFADAIVDLVLRSTGRRFSDQVTAHGRIGWDRVVWDLLESWTYSAAQRRGRYAGFDAYRVGPTPPTTLELALGAPAATTLWTELSEFRLDQLERPAAGDEGGDDDGAGPDDILVIDGPGPVSTVFIELASLDG